MNACSKPSCEPLRSGGVYSLSCRGSLGLCGRTTGSCPCLLPCHLSKQNIFQKRTTAHIHCWRRFTIIHQRWDNAILLHLQWNSLSNTYFLVKTIKLVFGNPNNYHFMSSHRFLRFQISQLDEYTLPEMSVWICRSVQLSSLETRPRSYLWVPVTAWRLASLQCAVEQISQGDITCKSGLSTPSDIVHQVFYVHLRLLWWEWAFGALLLYDGTEERERFETAHAWWLLWHNYL